MTIINSDELTTWELSIKFNRLARRVVQLEEEVADLNLMNQILTARIEELEANNE